MIAVANALVASWLPVPSHLRASRSKFLRLGGPIRMADAGEPDLDLLDSRIREVREGLTDCGSAGSKSAPLLLQPAAD